MDNQEYLKQVEQEKELVNLSKEVIALMYGGDVKNIGGIPEHMVPIINEIKGVKSVEQEQTIIE